MFEAVIRVKSTHLIKSCLKTRKYGSKIIFFYINLHLRDRLDIEFTASLLRRAGARGSADIFTVFNAYR